jgi:hypothetical protein
MKTSSRDISRRRFIVSTGLVMTSVCLLPRHLFGEEKDIVAAARKSGEAAKVTFKRYAETSAP